MYSLNNPSPKEDSSEDFSYIYQYENGGGGGGVNNIMTV